MLLLLSGYWRKPAQGAQVPVARVPRRYRKPFDEDVLFIMAYLLFYGDE